MFFFCSTPHHVSVKSRQTQVYNLPEILIYSIDSLFTSCSDSGTQVINNGVNLGCWIFLITIICVFQQDFQSFDQLMSASSEVAHGLTLWNNPIIIILTFLKFPFLTFELFLKSAFLFLHDLNVQLLAIPAVFSSHFVPLLFVHRLAIILTLGISSSL